MAAPDQADKPKGIEFHGGYQVYSESGVDLTLLRGNLQRSLQERWERGRRALASALALRQAFQRGKESSPPINWEEWKVEGKLDGLPVRILSVDGLITAKKAAGRNKDHLHLLELIELKKILDAASETPEG